MDGLSGSFGALQRHLGGTRPMGVGPVLGRAAPFTSTEVVYGVTGTEVTVLPEYGVSP